MLYLRFTIILTTLIATASLSAAPLAGNNEKKQSGIPIYDSSGFKQAVGKNPDAIVFTDKSKTNKVKTARIKKAPALFKGVDKDTLAYYQIGLASWYGKRFHGRKTASGAKFDMYQYTAAHRTLPFGTRLLVRNLKNGKEVTVTVNDRGPYVQNRILDLSYAAAVSLGYEDKGVAKVGIIIIDNQPIQNNVAQNKEVNKNVRLNLSDPDNLPHKKPQKISSNKTKDPFLLWENQGKPFYKTQNKRAVFLTEETNKKTTFTFEKPKKSIKPKSDSHSSPRDGSISLQVGSFKVKDNALRLKSRLEKDYQEPVFIHKERNWYKVRMGEFSSRTQAKHVQKELKSKGLRSLIHKN